MMVWGGSCFFVGSAIAQQTTFLPVQWWQIIASPTTNLYYSVQHGY
ncbi:hypothetical protein [Calothrix sp. UHCC 0171]|nr:hypothetical protein [Calothrix sp. UHCC 0171]MEA5574732.1 hypothetical protein [Calothrix sp. UHCC 0171]